MNSGGRRTMCPKSHANEEASTSGNMETNGPKRKRSGLNNCHQCHRNDKEIAVRCTKCKQKNYCVPCISKWYTRIEADLAEACPFCRKICNCTACLQSAVANKGFMIPDLELSITVKIQYSKYIVRVLLPYLKQFSVEQSMERAEGARIQELVTKAETLAGVCILTDAAEASDGACSCLSYGQGSRDSYSNCPILRGVGKAEHNHFQWHLQRGEPVIVPNVLSRTYGLSWEPLVMWRACRKSRRGDSNILEFNVINCLNGCKEKIKMHQFFKGYGEGLVDNKGRPRILKLEDWPPAESFQGRLPRHFAELIRCLPFIHNTHPHAGFLNIAAKLPDMSLKSDMGLKMCFSYGVHEELGFGSVTNLQYSLSDRVNVLMHTAARHVNPEHVGENPSVSSVSIKKENEDAMENQQYKSENKNKGKEKLDPSTSECRVQRFEGTEGGAVWDIFRRQDVPKLEEYLRRHYEEFSHIFPLQQLIHPIHEKAFYLTVEHKRKLKEEYGIEPWTFIQRLGDAVFIPAGCPYQIRNLKSCTSVNVNFVSPESVGECIRLAEEYSRLPHNHSCKEDKLQVKKMAFDAVSEVVHYLDAVTLSRRRCVLVACRSSGRGSVLVRRASGVVAPELFSWGLLGAGSGRVRGCCVWQVAAVWGRRCRGRVASGCAGPSGRAEGSCSHLVLSVAPGSRFGSCSQQFQLATAARSRRLLVLVVPAWVGRGHIRSRWFWALCAGRAAGPVAGVHGSRRHRFRGSRP